MSSNTERDPFLEHAREDAEGTELLESSDRDALLEKEREEAQGVEVFEDPDATIPGSALKEGAPGEEAFTGDSVGLGREDDDRAETEEESR
ncbi:MAG: hypothetical protein ACLFRT_08435 [Actinomycetota bacterium]